VRSAGGLGLGAGEAIGNFGNRCNFTASNPKCGITNSEPFQAILRILLQSGGIPGTAQGISEEEMLP
jgi:hypothetical protein